MGGVRVGQITAITPETDSETGELHADSILRWIPDVEPLPEDSTVTVRARSALGLKYLELAPGRVGRGLRVGRDRAAYVRAARPATSMTSWKRSTSRRGSRSQGTSWSSATPWRVAAPT